MDFKEIGTKVSRQGDQDGQGMQPEWKKGRSAFKIVQDTNLQEGLGVDERTVL